VKLPGPVVTAIRSSAAKRDAGRRHHARDQRHQRFGIGRASSPAISAAMVLLVVVSSTAAEQASKRRIEGEDQHR